MRLGIICGILVFGGLFVSGVSFLSQDSSSVPVRVVNEDPAEVVARFVELSGHAKYDEVKMYTTHLPEIYLDIAGKQMMSFRETTTEEVSANTNSIPSGVVVMNRTDPMRFYGIETDAKLMNREEEFIARVEQVWINGSEARVRVEIGSRKSQKYKSERDFLLYKEESGWKVFVVEYPIIRTVYGIPAEERPTKTS